MQLTIEIPDEQARSLGMSRQELERWLSDALKQAPPLSFVDEIVDFGASAS